MSLQFDGVDDIVTLPSIPGSQRFSIFAWVAPTTLGEGGEGVVLAHGATVTPRIMFGMDSIDRIKLEAQNSANRGKWCTANSTIVLNTWQSIGVSHDGSVGSGQLPTLYIDGAVSTRTIISNATQPMSSDAQIGYVGNVSSLSRTFKGNIGELALWNRLLSAMDFAAIHNLGVNAVPDHVLYLPFDWVNVAQDLGPSRYLVTVTGATTGGNPYIRPAGRRG